MQEEIENRSVTLVITTGKLAIMPGNRCILQIQGVHPFYSRKYDITKHPMYPLLADADGGNRLRWGMYEDQVKIILYAVSVSK